MFESKETIPEIIERASEFYATDAAVDQLGESTATLLQRLISHAVAVEIDGKDIYIPENGDPESVPIVSLNKYEKVRMSEQFLNHTPKQKEMTVSIINSWGPIDEPSHIQAEKISSTLAESKIRQTFALAPNTAAYVSHPEATFAVDGSKFTNLPTGYSILTGRPILGLLKGMEIGPDILGHELMHMHQRILRPITTFNSQESIDMTLLRDELEGYHVGAMVRIAMEGGKKPYVPYRIPIQEMGRLVQIQVDTIREKNNRGAEDPFRPTKQIQRQISNSIGMSVLHHTVNFDEVMTRLRKHATFEIT